MRRYSVTTVESCVPTVRTMQYCMLSPIRQPERSIEEDEICSLSGHWLRKCSSTALSRRVFSET